MSGGLQSRSRDDPEPATETQPVVSVCESCPGKLVFLEAGNTDGWIATDSAVELSP